MKPFSWGITALFLFSILFEPLRLALWRLGDEVGGVGGVGGLTNQFTPIHCAQNHSDGEFMMCTKPYYFRAGWMGLTPFAGIVLLICTLPLLAAAVASILGTSTRTYIKCKKVFGTERLLNSEAGELEGHVRPVQGVGCKEGRKQGRAGDPCRHRRGCGQKRERAQICNM